MSEIKARYIGPSETGVDLRVTLANEETRPVHVKKGGELPTEIDGIAVPASFRDSLLAQTDNWTTVKRSSDTTTKKQEGDR